MVEETFHLSDAAKAAGVETHVIRAWLQRKTIWFEDSEMLTAEANGLPHRLTYLSVLRIAIMSRLVKLGIAPSRAWGATIAFTDIGDSGFIVGDLRKMPARGPGELYREGYTILLAYDDAVPGQVLNMLPDTPMHAAFFPRMCSEPRKAEVAMVNINFVDRQVRDLLIEGDA